MKVEYITDRQKRNVTFNKRKAGLMKKAYELATLTGTQCLLMCASETGDVFTFATPQLQPIIQSQRGRELIKACLTHTSVAAVKSNKQALADMQTDQLLENLFDM